MSSQHTGFCPQQGSNIKCLSNVKQQMRLEPQGQETNENQGRFPSNISSDSTRYVKSNSSLSEVGNPILLQQNDSNSNRSSMDIATCSYNTLIIHNDDNLCSLGIRDFPISPAVIMKERARSYGESGMQEITEIPDHYLNQSHVLKHLAKEIKIPSTSNNRSCDSSASENIYKKNNSKNNLSINDRKTFNKSKSKSQPDLNKFLSSDIYNLESLTRENATLKQQLLICRMKVAKTQKLEDEVTNVYQVYEELVQSCERREKLERVARLRLQENLQKVQTLNRALKDQVDIFQTQLLTPTEHQLLIAQLFTQNKELLAAKERQDIELSAQQATLQEQRTHIGILDTALNNAQKNIRRLEEELRKKQLYIDRMNQTHFSIQLKENEQKIGLGYDSGKDSNCSGSSTNRESKWQLQEINNQFMSLETTQKNMEHKNQSASKISLDKTHTQETERIIAEVKQDKLRYLEDVFQVHLKGLENRLCEKDALIRALQNSKICGSSFDSYNLSTDSYPLHPLRFNSPSFINTSNTNLLDQSSYGKSSSTKYNPVINVLTTGSGNYEQSSSNYIQNGINLQAITIPGSYSPQSSSYSTSFDQKTNSITQNSAKFNSSSSYENHYDDHMKKHIEEQLNKFQTLQRGLCCFPGLSAKKPNQSLLSDDVSILSTNNSNAFLQKLAHLDHRERIKREQDFQGTKGKTTDEIIFLEKQGRCSQKTRNNAGGNLAQVTQSVGQNMTDISNIERIPKENVSADLLQRKIRGNSLPPSALPRPPKSLKASKKKDYKFQNSMKSSQPIYSIKRCDHDFSCLEYSHCQSHFFSKNHINFEHKDYGTIKSSNELKNFGFRREFSKPQFTSTKKYELLENNLEPKNKFTESSSLKHSKLPNSRNLRHLYNSSEGGIIADSRVEYFKCEPGIPNSTKLDSKISSKYMRFRRNNSNDFSIGKNQENAKSESGLPIPIAILNCHTNIPKPKHNSIGGSENLYHI